jgi:hypothetical protein
MRLAAIIVGLVIAGPAWAWQDNNMQTTTGSYALTDDAYRTLIFAKAADGSIKATNQILTPGFSRDWVVDVPQYPPSLRGSTGNPAFDRAIAICDAHSHVVWNASGGGDTGQGEFRYVYDPDISEACAAVEAARAKSAAAHQQAETAQNDTEDKAFVLNYAKELKP